jgi:alcohol dehydrogenase class IV
VDAFEFLTVGRILFGRGVSAQIGEIAAGFGRRAMVISNAGEKGDGGAIDRLLEMLSAAGVRNELLRQRGEPAVADVDRGVELARKQSCDVVIGLGGGSAMDAAKAVAGLLTGGGSAIDYMEVIGRGRRITRPAAPWIAVPTTAGTGAEVTRNAVIASPEDHFKASIRSAHLLARVAVVDAELAVDVRPEITARAGMDALCQLIESYTSRGATPVTDALAAEGISLAGRSLLRAYRDGGDLDAREGMAMAALLSGITLTNAGLGAAHGFAAPLGANFPAPHGSVCGALLPHVMAANVEALRRESPRPPTLRRYASVGRRLSGRDGLSDPQAVDAGIQCVEQLARDLDLPPLGRFGLTEDRISEMVALAGRSSSMRYNPVRLSDEALAGILRKAM